MFLSTGTCIYDTHAVIQGMFSNDSTFLRTPKAGDCDSGFDFFDSQGNSGVNQHDAIQDRHRYSAGQEIASMFSESFFIGCGFWFAAYLIIVPLLHVFVWSNGGTTDVTILPFIFFLPATALIIYHGRVLIELDKNLRTTKTKSRIGLRKLFWVMMSCILYCIASITMISVPMIEQLRNPELLEQHTFGIPAIESLRGKFLITDLDGGLSNQQTEIWNALMFAIRLNRTLVKPKVITRWIDGSSHLGASNEIDPFDEVWDMDHFTQCARETLNLDGSVTVLADNDPVHYKAAESIQSQHIFWAQTWGFVHKGEIILKQFTETVSGTDNAADEIKMHLLHEKPKYIKIGKE